jgi:hypothetical protein
MAAVTTWWIAEKIQLKLPVKNSSTKFIIATDAASWCLHNIINEL